MKKIFLIILPVFVLFACKKSDTSSGGGSTVSPSANFIKQIIIHVPGQTGVDTAVFTYDTLGRLTQYHEAGVDTTTPSTTYYFDNFNFIYTGTNTLPTEYAYYDINNSSRVDLLSYNANGQLLIDSTLTGGYLQVSSSNNITSSIFYYYGNSYYSDSLSFNSGNLSQWAEDVLDTTLTPPAITRSFITTYNGYTTNSNPLYNLYPLATVLFENGTISINGILDPAFFYSKNLPATETYAGTAVSYQYTLTGTKLQQATETFNGTPYIFSFYY